MTDAEKRLWSRSRRRQLKGYQFYRQKIIGKYIVDSYCPKANLVIELDGGQHYSDIGKAKDRRRDDALIGMGIRVLPLSLDKLRVVSLVEPFAKGGEEKEISPGRRKRDFV